MTSYVKVNLETTVVLDAINKELKRSDVITTFELPHSINGVPLEIVGHDAFMDSGIKHLHVPSNIKIIRDWAFRNNNMSKLTFSEGIKKIDTGAFCSNALTTLIAPKSLEVIGYAAFSNNPFELIVMGDNLKHIDDNAFDDINQKVIIRCVEGSVCHEHFRYTNTCELMTQEELDLLYYNE